MTPPETEDITISSHGDIVIAVEMEPQYPTDPPREIRLKCETDVLKTLCYFGKSLRFNAQNGYARIVLKDIDAYALRVWLMYIHAAKDKKTDGDKDTNVPFAGVPDSEMKTLFQQAGMYDKSILHIWHIIHVWDYFEFDGALLADYFTRWYDRYVNFEKMTVDYARVLVLPCYLFDHAQGFADVTKWLVYNSAEYITEKRPNGFKWKHLYPSAPDLFGLMNQARDRVKTFLHTHIWERVPELVTRHKRHGKCTHWADSVGMYFSALVEADVYPLIPDWPEKSVGRILSTLRFKPMRLPSSCCYCLDLSSIAFGAQMYAEKYFDGLCIDCMERSKLPKGMIPDDEYWERNGKHQNRWDTRCRVKHGEPSWNSSWLGRSEHRQKLIKRSREGELRPYTFGSNETDSDSD